MPHLFVSVFEIQSVHSRHVPAILPKFPIIKVRADEDDIQEVAIWSLLEPIVPINQLWGKLSTQKTITKCEKWDFVGTTAELPLSRVPGCSPLSYPG